MPTPRHAIEHAIAFAEGVADGEDLAWVARGFALALHDGASLDLALGLPATAARRRKAIRDFWIAQAAAQLGDAPRWVKARELERIGREFESVAWPRLRALKSAPLEASPIETALFHLHRAGGRVPKARRLFDLVAIVAPEIATASGAACGLRDQETADATEPA